MKIYSWNVNGLRAGLKRGTFQEFIEKERPDVVCLQETKAKPGQAEVDLPEYEEYWESAKRPGYSGVAIMTKVKPISVRSEFSEGVREGYEWGCDACGNALEEGRFLALEFEKFYLVTVYVPNAKRGLERLGMRENVWDKALFEELTEMEKVKPVVVCGDFNVANEAIDLARPKDNEGNAGYTEEERKGMKRYLTKFRDSFRELHPEEVKYTWWSHWAQARQRNIGWRIDYFLVSPKLMPAVKRAEIHNDILGSDHCPVSIELEI